MTLNITVMLPHAVLQVSDRRMVDMRSGQVIHDEANKAIVTACADGVLATTFAGIGKVGSQRVDKWLAESMQDSHAPDMASDQVVAFVADAATKWFRTFPSPPNKRHSFVVAGWRTPPYAITATPSLWLISNCPEGNLDKTNRAEDSFTIKEFTPPKKAWGMFATGLVAAFTRSERRRLHAGLRAAAKADTMEQLVNRLEGTMVQVVRDAANNPQACGGIGKNCMATCLLPSGEARATYYPESGNSHSYAPHFLWKSAGAYALAGDIDVMPGWGYRVALGGDPAPVMLVVGRPAGASGAPPQIDEQKLAAAFAFRLHGELQPGTSAEIMRILR